MREEIIEKQFKTVLSYSQGIPYNKINLEKHFRTWERNKRRFYEMFGKELIYEIPNVSFPLGEGQKEHMFVSFSGYTHSRALNEFMEDQGFEAFFSNRVIREYPIDEDKRIPKGMKFSKALKYFVSDEKALEKMQIEYSQIIQEDRIKGTLCFSIHPLDYLSISENTYNWRSCHSLDGAYRGGNMSYLMDKATIICYLRGEDNCVLPRFGSVVWNSKKWRCLLHINNDQTVVFASRQYPFFSEQALIEMRKYLRVDILQDPSFTSWTNHIVSEISKVKFLGETQLRTLETYNYFPIRGNFCQMHEYVDNVPHSLNFNDLTSSSCYTPYYMWSSRYGNPDNDKFEIGHEVPCAICKDQSVYQNNSFTCGDCCYQVEVTEEDLDGWQELPF